MARKSCAENTSPPYGWMIIRHCLLNCGCKASSWLPSPALNELLCYGFIISVQSFVSMREEYSMQKQHL